MEYHFCCKQTTLEMSGLKQYPLLCNMGLWTHWTVISDDAGQAQLILAELPHASVDGWGVGRGWLVLEGLTSEDSALLPDSLGMFSQ